jgi:hypothetical protein
MTVENMVVKKDRVEMTFTGAFYLAEPVAGSVQGAVFIGRGNFRAEPTPVPFERQNTRRLLSADTVESDFRTAVLRFTDDSLSASNLISTSGIPPAEALELAAGFEKRFLKETGANVAARLALSVLNDEKPGFFLIQVDKGKRNRFTYVLDRQGRLPSMAFDINAGEVGLIFAHRSDWGNEVWLAFHSLDAYATGQAPYTSAYDLVRIDRYAMVVDVRDPKKSLKLSATMEGAAAVGGVRAIPFSLSENLSEESEARFKKAMRVKKVQLQDGTTVDAVQEDWESGFTLFLPSTLAQGQRFTFMTELEGEFLKASRYNGAVFHPIGTFEWYPRHGYLNRARYSLTFRHRKEHKVVSSGVRLREEVDPKAAGEAITEWRMDSPIPFATFAVGELQQARSSVQLQNKNVPIEFYWPSKLTLPARTAVFMGTNLNLSESVVGKDELERDVKDHLESFQIAIRNLGGWFGEYPYPSLNGVFAPGAASQGPATMILLSPEVGHSAHEIAHQWWGNLVSWRSYRDQWLSEGFAEYSEALTPTPDTVVAGDKAQPVSQKISKDLAKSQKEIIESMRASLLAPPRTTMGLGKGHLADLGPIILGQRLETRETLGAYDTLIYTKGALVLRMLHFLFTDPDSGTGEPFFEMMRDFVKTHENQSATSESFFAVASEHFARTPIAKRYRIANLDWFRAQWVENAYLPSYRLEYTLEPQPDKSVIVRGTVYQDNVPDNFITVLPVEAKFGKDQVGRFLAGAQGPMTPFAVKLPGPPDDVQLDPYRWILSEKTSTRRLR